MTRENVNFRSGAIWLFYNIKTNLECAHFLNTRGSVPGGANRVFSKLRNQLCGPLSLLSDRNRNSLSGGKADGA
jgi:hypothetical protein